MSNLVAYDGKLVELDGELYFQFERSEFRIPNCGKAIWVSGESLHSREWDEVRKEAWGKKANARVVGRIYSMNRGQPITLGFGHLGAYSAEIDVRSVSLIGKK